MAFSAEENAAIRETLLREARRCAVTLGLRKTSVEQLTEAAGISKGLFYKYFTSKELLFFEVLEDIHSEVYQVAEQALEEGKDRRRRAHRERAAHGLQPLIRDRCDEIHRGGLGPICCAASPRR